MSRERAAAAVEAAEAAAVATEGGQREGQIRMVIIVISARWEDSWEVPLLSSLAAVSNIGRLPRNYLLRRSIPLICIII